MTRNPTAMTLLILASGGAMVAVLLSPPAFFQRPPVPAAQTVLVLSLVLLFVLPTCSSKPESNHGPRRLFRILQTLPALASFIVAAQMPPPDLGIADFIQRLPYFGIVIAVAILAGAYSLATLRHRRLINWRKALSRIALVLAGLAAFALLLGLTGWTSPAMALWAGIIALGWLASLPWVLQHWKQFQTRRASTPALSIIANLASISVIVSLTTILHKSPDADLMPELIGAMIGIGSVMLVLRFRQDHA